MIAVTAKTRELTFAALDWAVAQAAGGEVRIVSGNKYPHLVRTTSTGENYTPSTDPSQAYPIIARVGIDTRQIWRGTHHLYAYDERDLKRYADAEVAARETIYGPSRYLKVPIAPHPSDGKWMAKLARSSDSMVQWSIKTDFLSDTMLIAAMRCYVASRLGDIVEIPEALHVQA